MNQSTLAGVLTTIKAGRGLMAARRFDAAKRFSIEAESGGQFAGHLAEFLLHFLRYPRHRKLRSISASIEKQMALFYVFEIGNRHC